jgi:hypothetical protein
MKSIFSVLTALVSLLMILAACAPANTTPDNNGTQAAIYTSAAETLYAQLTLSAGKTAVAQLTQIAQQPTSTPAPPTPLPPTATPVPTITPVIPTPIPVTCDWAEFVQHVTVADNTVVYPGSVFTKIWRVRNIGTCDWTSSYTLVFAGGDNMGNVSAVSLPGVVRPGETVDLSVTLTAPGAPGTYRSNWMLRNPAGLLFGYGQDAQQPLVVQIQVAQPPTQGNGIYDLALLACSALWRSNTAALGCPGSVSDPNGSVVLLNQPYLESRIEYQPALWTRPNIDPNGRILGQYPVYFVNSGDRFRTELGCLWNSPGCDVNFTLNYRTADGTVYNLGAWREIYDGRTTIVDIDLTSLSGNSIQFLLGVQNNGSAPNPNAFWFAPRIENAGPQTNQVLVWNQRGGSQNVCQELRILQTGSSRAVAQARSCKGSGQDLGSGNLTESEQSQLNNFMVQLAPFDAELFNAEAGEPLTSYMTFNGRGSAEALNPQITALNEFAQSVIRRLSQ